MQKNRGTGKIMEKAGKPPAGPPGTIKDTQCE